MNSKLVPDCTLTTACYLLNKYHSNSRPKEEILKSISLLLSIPCYLVIYCNKDIYEDLREIRENQYELGHLTNWQVKELEELWCSKFIEQIKLNREVYWPTRDARTCAESHALVCNKVDFVIHTMNKNPFNTSKFGWIDSNIGINGKKISEEFSPTTLLHILNTITDKFHIQILNVTDKRFKEEEHKKEYYQQYRWVVCGCLFTLSEKGRKILERVKEIIVKTTRLGYGHGEEMFFLEILDEFYDEIERGYGDYHHILHNFLEPTRGFYYIRNYIIQNYLNYSYYKEAYDCCIKCIKPIEEFRITVSPSEYFDILFKMYIASFYINIEKAKEVYKHIQDILHINPHVRKEYKKNKGFYDCQFGFIN
jgi:hypothetical protein